MRNAQRLYREASMLVLPSLEEGFGMTAVEAMQAGVPVIASARGALPEVVGDAGVLVDPDQRGRHRRGDRTAARQPDERRQRIAAGRAQAARFSWSDSAKTAAGGVPRGDGAAPGRGVKPAVLRIGVDARELLGDATGVGRYLSELLKRWADRQDASMRAVRPLRA